MQTQPARACSPGRRGGDGSGVGVGVAALQGLLGARAERPVCSRRGCGEKGVGEAKPWRAHGRRRRGGRAFPRSQEHRAEDEAVMSREPWGSQRRGLSCQGRNPGAELLTPVG